MVLVPTLLPGAVRSGAVRTAWEDEIWREREEGAGEAVGDAGVSTEERVWAAIEGDGGGEVGLVVDLGGWRCRVWSTHFCGL